MRVGDAPVPSAMLEAVTPVSGTDQLSRLKRLYTEHASFVRALLARLAGPGIDADDLTQEVFLVAWRRLDLFACEVPERARLYGIAVRVASDARRRAKVHRFLGIEAAAESPDPGTPASALEQSEAKRLVYRMLEPMSARKRPVFILFEIHQMSGEEIAQAVGCPVSTVWTRLFH